MTGLRYLVALSLAVGFVAGAVPIVAHHSAAAAYDETKKVEAQGKVTKVMVRNPHSWVFLEGTDDKGEKVEWSLEWGSPNSLGRQGIRPSTFPAGARATMRLRPMLNGAPAGAFVGAKFADGKTVGRWDD